MTRSPRLTDSAHTASVGCQRHERAGCGPSRGGTDRTQGECDRCVPPRPPASSPLRPASCATVAQWVIQLIHADRSGDAHIHAPGKQALHRRRKARTHRLSCREPDRRRRHAGDRRRSQAALQSVGYRQSRRWARRLLLARRRQPVVRAACLRQIRSDGPHSR